MYQDSPISVLLTSTSPKKLEFIKLLKNNPDQRDVRVYCTNSCKKDLPTHDQCDGSFVVPRFDSPSYTDILLDICREKHIDILMPRLSYELLPIAFDIQSLKNIGTKVAIDSFQNLRIINNKSELYKHFPNYMPEQIIAEKEDDVYKFANRFTTFCCKLSNAAGAEGFAVIDNKKCDDVSLFHSYGKKHYISLSHLVRIVKTQSIKYILQEYIPGTDYSVSILADKGKILAIVGYYGYEMEFSCIMHGEISQNSSAFQICHDIVSKMSLSGILGFDFIIDKQQHAHLLEINPRLHASLPFVAAAGINIPYLYCKLLLGEDICIDDSNVINGLIMRKHYAASYYLPNC